MSSTTPDLTALPSPTSLTLLLKSGKSTTLLSLPPTCPTSEIAPLLLAALRSRNVSSLPSFPSSIDLGVLLDKRDASKGWISLEERVRELAAKKGGRAKEKGSKDPTVEAAGLVDGSWVAWRVRGKKKEGEVTMDDDGSGVVDIGSDVEEEDPGWDVEIPKYEDEEEEEEEG